MNEIEKEELRQYIREAIEDIFFSEEEFSPFNSLQDNIRKLLDLREREDIRTKINYADKFEDYMKNIDKLNMMINEFKGLVSIVRGQVKSNE